MTATNLDSTVAVIGLGALGLVTLKNLVEEGFDVTGFESKEYVGGLWKFTTEPTTSVLPSTVTNISKERGCYTDFPFADDVSSHIPAADVASYLESYTDHFQLRRFMRLGTCITSLLRDDVKSKWIIKTSPNGETLEFDKVVIATGINQTASIPSVKNIDLFEGTVIHSQEFKIPENFKGKNVVVVGLGSTAVDTATELVGHARKIYISHRHGVYILPRSVNGQPADHSLTYKLLKFQGALDRWFPGLAERIFNLFVKKLQNNAFPSILKHEEWGLWPAPSIKQSVPTVSDEIVTALEKNTIESVPGIASVVGPRSVQLNAAGFLETDKTSTPRCLDDIDAIIFCTGYAADLGKLLEPRLNPSRNTTPAWYAASGSRGKPLPRLYKNLLSLDHPQSLAFMGAVAFPTPAFQLYDIASMALAQIWSGKAKLPSSEDMEKSVDMHHEWMCKLAQNGPVYPGMVNQSEWLAWADRTAGTGIADNLGWGLQSWKFWLQDRAFYKLLTGGVYSPHLYRVFDGRRKKWDGARLAIEKMNKEVQEGKKKPKQP